MFNGRELLGWAAGGHPERFRLAPISLFSIHIGQDSRPLSVSFRKISQTSWLAYKTVKINEGFRSEQQSYPYGMVVYMAGVDS